MRKLFFASLLALLGTGIRAEDNLYQDRWFYCSHRVEKAADVDFYADLVVKAKRGGYNGLLFAGGLEGAFKWSESRKDLFRKVKGLCEDAGIEVVPLVWTPGYGSFLWLEPDLVEYEPVKGIPYRREGNRLVFDSVLPPIPNLDFETFDAKKNRFSDWGADQPGVVSFVETNRVHGGKACLRMEPSYEKNPHGHARLMRTIEVTPGRRYRFSVTTRTEGLKGKAGCLRLQVYVAKGPNIGAKTVKVPSGGTLDWMVETLDFPSGDASHVTLYFGTWGGEGGTFWVDDVSVTEIGLHELALRKDCQPVLRSAATGKTFTVGTDYLLPTKRPSAARDVAFTVPVGSALADGEKILVDGYVVARHGPKMQCSNCMSNPRFYELVEESAAEIQRLVAPKKWFFSVDEVRNGNTCPLCTARKTDMAHILGDCVTKMYQTVKRQNPDATVYAWADMFSPHHNAKDSYFGCRGSFEGIWDLLPKDIVMNCWSWGLAPKDMKFLTEKGFRVQAAGYYDSHTVDGDIEWIDLLNTIPGATGWMYTTWQGDFEHLEEYGRLRNARSRPLAQAAGWANCSLDFAKKESRD